MRPTGLQIPRKERPLRKPEILMTPGPTPVPPEALLAQGAPIVYHRGPGFAKLITDVTDGLKWILATENDVLTFTCSGTGMMESAVCNLFSAGDKVMVVSVGNFGKRFSKICAAYGLEVDFVDVPWGQTAKAEEIKARLTDDTKAVLVQHSETSTGVVNDLEAIGKVLKDHPALYVVDSVSGVGAARIKVDEWGIDVCVTGSQKALMMSPGIGAVSFSKAAWAATEKATLPRFYFDWKRTKEFYEKPVPETPFTPAVSLYAGLAAAIELIKEEGLENTYRRHEVMSEAVKQACIALGLEIFGEDPDRSVCVTAVKCPEGLDGDALTKLVRAKYSIIFAPGQDHLKGKIFRIGHIGYLERIDILQAIAVLELALDELGYPVKFGTGVAAAQEVFRRA
jgi:serine---pyruvate transaminase